ncbi:MAG: TRAP transporter small permease [Thermovirgaceae bacterium]
MSDSCSYEEPRPVVINNPVWEFLLKIQRFILILCSLFVVVSIGTAVVLRYVFKNDLYGLEEIVVIFAFWLYFTGGAYGSYTRTHITADLVSVYVPEGGLKAALMAFSSAVTFGLSGLFTWWGYEFFMFGVQMGARTPVWRIPQVVSYTAVFLGFFMMSFYFFFDLLADLGMLSSFIRKGKSGNLGTRDS